MAKKLVENEAGRSKVRGYRTTGSSAFGQSLDLIYNVFCVGKLLQHQKVWFEAVHEHLALAGFSYIQHLLYHVVSKLVLGHLKEAAAYQERGCEEGN